MFDFLRGCSIWLVLNEWKFYSVSVELINFDNKVMWDFYSNGIERDLEQKSWLQEIFWKLNFV